MTDASRSGAAAWAVAAKGMRVMAPDGVARMPNEASRRPRLNSFVFTTEGMPMEERFDQLRAYVDGINDFDLDKPHRERFEARSESWRLGAMLFTSNSTPRMRMTRTRAQATRDGLETVIIRLMKSGRSHSFAGGATYGSVLGGIVIENLSTPFSDEWTAAEWVSINISPSADPQLCAGLAALGVGAVGGTGATLLADYLLALAHRLPDAAPEEEQMLAQTSRAMIAGCLLTEAAPRLVAAKDRSQVARAAVERVIRRNIASARLDAERIAELAGVSRSTLFRLFHRDGGVASYVQSLRLELVAAELRDPSRADESIAAVAGKWGLYCPASFSRAFRKAYDCTPSDARAGALLGAPVRPEKPALSQKTLTLATLLAPSRSADATDCRRRGG